MAILIRELRKNPEKFKELATAAVSCDKCGVQMQETLTGKRHTDDGDYCSDCYYEKLGDLIEQSPISTARVRRG